MTADAEKQFYALEQRLLAATLVRGRAEVRASGLIEVALNGEFTLQPANVVTFDFSGRFSGDPVEPRLTSDGRQMSGGSLDKTFDQPTPLQLQEAICTGFTRMGILHNLARLSFGAPPDHAEGGAAEWVTVSDFSWRPPQDIDGQAATALHFRIAVDGSRDHEATLYLDQETGRPLARSQTTYFPDGPMFVEERYPELDIIP